MKGCTHFAGTLQWAMGGSHELWLKLILSPHVLPLPLTCWSGLPLAPLLGSLLPPLRSPPPPEQCTWSIIYVRRKLWVMSCDYSWSILSLLVTSGTLPTVHTGLTDNRWKSAFICCQCSAQNDHIFLQTSPSPLQKWEGLVTSYVTRIYSSDLRRKRCSCSLTGIWSLQNQKYRVGHLLFPV